MMEAEPERNGLKDAAKSHLDALTNSDNFILLVLSKIENDEGLTNNFFGTVVNVKDSSKLPSFSKKNIFLCGDIAVAHKFKPQLEKADGVFVVREISEYYSNDNGELWPTVGLGQVPIHIHGVGVYYRRFFDAAQPRHFKRICSDHTFQTLTESTKPGIAHRSGAYLTRVQKEDDDLHFHLLRCSTNFAGPTLNFSEYDTLIIDALNQKAKLIFENQAPLNHVLAQIYTNERSADTGKQIKAKIKAHADKTKDMPRNGIMAFCTFYDQLEKLQPMGLFDYGHKNVTGLTKLNFQLKKTVEERPGCTLAKKFSITLYPDSVFFMPLSTNRLYTHEIKAAALDAELLPTRMGYVVRCSKTEAVHKDGQTSLKMNGKLVPLEPATPEGMADLRKMYAQENLTDDIIDYGDKFLFSMNEGDYTAPEYNIAKDFRSFSVSAFGNLFEELLNGVDLENVTKGRKGNVLVLPDDTRGTPIVRTTSKYCKPPESFRSAHVKLAQDIQQLASLQVPLNNALIEVYDNNYNKMGFHSDQALDLEEGSSVAVFSCYKDPELANPPRKLVVESKEPGGNKFEVALTHNSVVVFSLDVNRLFKHKIVLDITANPPPNEWLGITFRTSKTFVQYKEEGACLEDGTHLTLADENQRKEFYKLRRRENNEMDFNYPCLLYTISESDLMPPKSPEALT